MPEGVAVISPKENGFSQHSFHSMARTTRKALPVHDRQMAWTPGAMQLSDHHKHDIGAEAHKPHEAVDTGNRPAETVPLTTRGSAMSVQPASTTGATVASGTSWPTATKKP